MFPSMIEFYNSRGMIEFYNSLFDCRGWYDPATGDLWLEVSVERVIRYLKNTAAT